MRSTSRRRTTRSVLALAVALVVTVAACTDDDDDAGEGTTAVGAPAATTDPTGADEPPATGPAPAGATAGSPAPVTEPVVPTLDDTVEVGGSQLSTVDLSTGTATRRGRIGGEDVGILGLAFVPGQTSTVYGLTDAPELVTFDVDDPSTLLTTVPIDGVASGSTLLAIDVDLEDGSLLRPQRCRRALRDRPGHRRGHGHRHRAR